MVVNKKEEEVVEIVNEKKFCLCLKSCRHGKLHSVELNARLDLIKQKDVCKQ